MISTLSGYQGITVLSSSTSFHTQEAAMTDDRVRNELGVNYIVQGSVQFMGQEGRINLELVDLLTGTVKWSELLDFKKDNIFAAQDDISREILKELSINISTGNRQAANWAADFGNIDIFTEFLNWRIEWAKQNKKGYLKSQMMLDALLEKPLPDVMRYGLPAWQLFQKVSLGLSEDQDSDLKELQSMIKKMDQFQRDEEAYVLKTMVGMYIFNLGCDQAKENIVKAMEIGGNTSDNLNAASRVFIRCGEPKKAIDAARKLLILNPNDTGWGKTKILISYLHVDGQIEEIKKIMEGKLDAPDMHSQILLYFAFLAYKDGDIELANNYFQRASEKTFGLEDFKRTLNIRDNNHEIIQGLVELGLDL